MRPKPAFPTTSLFPDYSSRRIQRDDADYPQSFNNLAQPPRSIWIAGSLAIAAAPAVAIVGTRNASTYGLRVARQIAAVCARAGVCVVSGLARGIDGAAHESALENGGRTVGVLGTPIDVAFPRHHRVLQQQIAHEGLLVSEMEPGERAAPWTFPRRNRLIAALSQIIVVVEAGEKSGALLTAGHADGLNVLVAAVPGMIDAPQAAGTNRLIRDGAHIIAEPSDVLALLSVDSSPAYTPSLSGDDAQLWDALTQGATDISALARRAGLSLRDASAAVTSLEIAGLVNVDHLGVVFAVDAPARV